MKIYNAEFLETYYNEHRDYATRVINGHQKKVWPTIKKYLSTGKLTSKEDALICYKEIKDNKDWYYKMNLEYRTNYLTLEDNTLIEDSTTMISLYNKMLQEKKKQAKIDFQKRKTLIFKTCMLLSFFLNILAIISLPITLNSNFFLLSLSSIGIFGFSSFRYIFLEICLQSQKESIEREVKHLLFYKDIDEIEQKLEHILGIDTIRKNIVNEITENVKETTKNDEKEKPISEFVKIIGKTIELITNNPYPNCDEDIKSLSNLATEYIEYTIKEIQSKETITLDTSPNFYTKLVNLEAKIRESIQINETRKQNEEYLRNIIEEHKTDSSAANIYLGSTIHGQIPTISEQFDTELQNYDTTNKEDKGHRRILSPNNR